MRLRAGHGAGKSDVGIGAGVAATVRGVTRNQAVLIRAFCIWTVYVWANRLWNILQDDEHDTAFKAVHSVLAIISVAFAVAVFLVVRKIRKSTLNPSPSNQANSET